MHKDWYERDLSIFKAFKYLKGGCDKTRLWQRNRVSKIENIFIEVNIPMNE